MGSLIETLFICCPSGQPVLLRSSSWVLCFDYASANNNNIASPFTNDLKTKSRETFINGPSITYRAAYHTEQKTRLKNIRYRLTIQQID